MKDERLPEPLVVRLLALAKAEDRAALSALRRSLVEGAEANAYPYVVPFLPKDTSPWTEQVYFLVAGLFALHPQEGPSSLGAAMRIVGQRSGSQSVEQRFVALLDAHPEDIGPHLRHAISLVRGYEIGIDWTDLLRALRSWRSGHHRRRWARDYWARTSSDGGSSE